MEEDLRGLIRAARATGSVLAPPVEVNWGEHPQGAGLPAVVLNRVSGAEGYSQDGPNGLLQARVQVDAYAADETDAIRLGRELEALLSGFRGSGASGHFDGVFLTATRSGREGGTNEDERPFRRSMDFDVNWRKR